MFKLLGWTFGQILHFNNMKALIIKIFSGAIPAKRIFAAILSVFELFNAACFKTPISPLGDPVDLSGYSLVYEDDFNGDELNTDDWYYRCEGERRDGFNGASQVKVKDGNLILTAEYLEDGEYGTGWYTGMIALKQTYKQGYFEIRCKCNEGDGFWSAFWLQATGAPYDHVRSDGGREAVELDIFESTDEKTITGKGMVTSAIHCNGYDDDEENIDSQRIGKIIVGDINDYNTYGLKWTEDEYIFYVNGVETARSSFGKGVCRNAEEVIISLEMPEEIPDSIAADKGYSTQMVVDYVRIYQIEG